MKTQLQMPTQNAERPPAGAHNATETAAGQVFPTQVTFIQVRNATTGVNQTGQAASSPRASCLLARPITTPRAAAY
jgi:hypothetical protein